MPTMRVDSDVMDRLWEIKHYLKKSGLKGATYSDAIRWLLSVAEMEIKALKTGRYKLVKEIKGVCCVFEKEGES